jgi:hypothetical protein
MIWSYSFDMFMGLLLLFGFHDFRLIFHSVGAFHPKSSIALDPGIHFDQGLDAQTARPSLRRAAARDEAGALKDVEVAGESGSADSERPGQLVYGSFAILEPSQDAAANRMGEGRKGSIEVLHSFTFMLMNTDSNYKKMPSRADELGSLRCAPGHPACPHRSSNIKGRSSQEKCRVKH